MNLAGWANCLGCFALRRPEHLTRGECNDGHPLPLRTGHSARPVEMAPASERLLDGAA